PQHVSNGHSLQMRPQPMSECLDAPLALRLPAQPELAAQLNSTNYQTKVEGVAASGNEVTINSGEQGKIIFTAAKGGVTSTKEFTFYGDRMIFDAKASVTGSESPAQLVIGSGFGDQSDKAGGSYSTPPQIVMYTTD